jgi:hypothetical protein
MKANTIGVGPLCKYVNNHTKFAILLNDCVEEWGAELSDKHAVALSDKAEYTCTLFMENSSTGVENIARLLFVEVKDILKVRRRTSNAFVSCQWSPGKCVCDISCAVLRGYKKG